MGCLFTAIKGTRVDGHQFIDQAVEKGARIIVCESLPSTMNPEVVYVSVPDSSFAFGVICSNFFDNPSRKLKLVGVSGTNGKTSIATLLFHLFRNLGYSAGLVSTIENRINERVYHATHTSPDPLQLNELLAAMAEDGCEYCFMEVSSHAVHQKRIAGQQFSGGIFTNLTHDHLDYHKTFEEYLKAKKSFYDQLPESAFALTNADDKNGRVMLQNTRAAKYTYSIRTSADFKGKILESSFDGLLLSLNGTEIWSRLLGTFNAWNLTAVYGAASLLGVENSELLQQISKLEPVNGRFQFMKSPGGVVAVVDYAHSPDAVKNILQTISDIRTGNEKLITVIGAGGDRDRAKRPIMAAIAVSMSDLVILTSDNPRTEDPEAIIREMQQGVGIADSKKAVSITDRIEAIKTACAIARKGDIILVAGKGHETYQEVNGVRHHFDDREILQKYLLPELI